MACRPLSRRACSSPAAAGDAPPAALDTRNETCRSCRMPVSDPRLAAQLAAPGEEPVFFDDIGCLRDFLREHAPDAGLRRLRGRSPHGRLDPRGLRVVRAAVPRSTRRWARTSSPTPTLPRAARIRRLQELCSEVSAGDFRNESSRRSQERRMSMETKIPQSIQIEHEELHEQLARAIKAGGKTGEAARAVMKVLQPHMAREEEFVAPCARPAPAGRRGHAHPGHGRRSWRTSRRSRRSCRGCSPSTDGSSRPCAS